MPTQLQLPKMNEDDAYGRLIAFLRQSPSSEPGGRSHRRSDGEQVISIQDLVMKIADEARRNDPHRDRGMAVYSFDFTTHSAPLYDAAWTLVRTGVLRPAVPPEQAGAALAASYFSITAYGREWLERSSGFECLPSEYGRFGQLLGSQSERLGAGYHARSQEALACYRAQTYLACCAMCGAAAESITLALAIGRVGDEEAVLAEYRKASGRGTIERRLMAQQNGHVQRELTNYFGLLNYWRDEAAHGERSGIGEGEAFTALLTLLRFAMFAGGRWSELTRQ